jgi:uncharacterized delta-60 repeat protein
MKESKWSATHFRALSLLLLIGALSNDSSAAPGDLDLSFDTGSGINGPVLTIPVRTMVIQPDGKILIGGEFTTVKGLVRTNLARLNADGSGDSNFLAGIPLPGGQPISTIHLLALQPDGRVLAAHEPYELSRFSTNGTPDVAFSTNAHAVLGSLTNVQSIGITAVIAQPDGKVLVGGAEYLLRLNSDGTHDISFIADYFENDPYPYSLCFALQSDGKVLVAVSLDSNTLVATRLIRLNANGSVDGTFNSFTNVSGTSQYAGITGIAAQPDGKVLIGGVFIAVNGVSRFGLARLNSNGSVDMSFNPAQPGAQGFVLQPDGKVHLGKSRLNADGSLDSTFNFPSEFQTFSVSTPTPALQPDGKVILAGILQTSFGSRPALVRFNTGGSHDATLDTGTEWLNKNVWETISSIKMQPGGKVLIGGYANPYFGGSPGPAFVHGTNIYGRRLNADGSRDQTFTSANFYAYFTNIGPTIDPQVCNQPWDLAVSVGAQSDGKVIIGGITYANCCDDSGCLTETFPFLDRAHANGSRDTNFHPGINVDVGVNALVVLSNDKILVAGSFSIGSNPYAVARLNADGSLDNTFTPFDVFLPNGAGRGFVLALAVQGDGKVLIGGAFSSVNGTSRNGIARINGNGTLDTSFNPGTGPSGGISAVALQPDGKVLIGGGFTNVDGTTRNRIARLNASGSLDPSFDPGSGPDASVSAIAVQPDGNVLIAGDFLTVNGVMRQYVARLFGDSPLPLLNIMRSGSSLTVSWPASFGNFQLQENTNVSLANGWSAVAEARSTNNNSISVALPATGSRIFFRLSSP